MYEAAEFRLPITASPGLLTAKVYQVEICRARKEGQGTSVWKSISRSTRLIVVINVMFESSGDKWRQA